MPLNPSRWVIGGLRRHLPYGPLILSIQNFQLQTSWNYVELEDDNFVAFRNITPAASHHYLVIPKDHIRDAVRLKPYHIPMLYQMEAIAAEILKQQGAVDTATRTILDRVLGARAAGVNYRLFSVWTLVPVRRDQQLSDHSTVDEIASGAADCRLTYTMANCPQRRKKRKREREKGGKRAGKRQGLVVLGSGEENPRVLLGDADQESETRMSKNALRTGRRQAVE
ncbi:hypothetical protein TNCV_4771061 [Trichonephila clavipes]|nr:hypothetical protein TNCV_4771061 [Trichonephila clavipes]